MEESKLKKPDEPRRALVSAIFDERYSFLFYPWGKELLATGGPLGDLTDVHKTRKAQLASIRTEVGAGNVDSTLAQRALQWGVYNRWLFHGTPPIMTLPNELLEMILERLDPTTLLFSVPRVCRRMRWLCGFSRRHFATSSLSQMARSAELGLPKASAQVLAVQDIFVQSRISAFEALTCLNLDFQGIERLPDSIYKLQSLKELSVCSNRLTSLPDSIGRLASSLEKLDVSENPLCFGTWSSTRYFAADTIITITNTDSTNTLPESIRELVNLKYLAASNINMTQVPPWIGQLEKLIELTIDRNPLKELPEAIKGLKTLMVLSANRIGMTQVPPWIGDLEELKLLCINGNPLNKLPIEIQSLKNLIGLELRDIKDITLPGWQFTWSDSDTLKIDAINSNVHLSGKIDGKIVTLIHR